MSRMTKDAYRLSEEFEVPVMIRMTTRVCHSKSLVTEGSRVEVALFCTKSILNEMMLFRLFPKYADISSKLAKKN